MRVAHRRLLAGCTMAALIGVAGCSTAPAGSPGPATQGARGSSPGHSAGSDPTGTVRTSPKGSAGQPSGARSSTSPGNATSTTGSHAATGAGGGSTSAKQQPVLDRLPGSTHSGCVTVGGQRDVRSGSMAGGPFDEARRQFAHSSARTPAVRLYWIPAHGVAAGGSRVTATRLAPGPQISRTVTQRHASTAGRWAFYDTQVPIASAGTWRFTVSAGPDKGCFSVVFRR